MGSTLRHLLSVSLTAKSGTAGVNQRMYFRRSGRTPNYRIRHRTQTVANELWLRSSVPRRLLYSKAFWSLDL